MLLLRVFTSPPLGFRLAFTRAESFLRIAEADKFFSAEFAIADIGLVNIIPIMIGGTALIRTELFSFSSIRKNQRITTVSTQIGRNKTRAMLLVYSGAYRTAILFRNTIFLGEFLICQSFVTVSHNQIFLGEAHQVFLSFIKFDIIGTPELGAYRPV